MLCQSKKVKNIDEFNSVRIVVNVEMNIEITDDKYVTAVNNNLFKEVS